MEVEWGIRMWNNYCSKPTQNRFWDADLYKIVGLILATHSIAFQWVQDTQQHPGWGVTKGVNLAWTWCFLLFIISPPTFSRFFLIFWMNLSLIVWPVTHICNSNENTGAANWPPVVQNQPKALAKRAGCTEVCTESCHVDDWTGIVRPWHQQQDVEHSV